MSVCSISLQTTFLRVSMDDLDIFFHQDPVQSMFHFSEVFHASQITNPSQSSALVSRLMLFLLQFRFTMHFIPYITFYTLLRQAQQ